MTYHIAAALILDDEGRTLVVRKRGTIAFMQAGGKIEPGEEPIEALRRELMEELNIAWTVEPVFLGHFTAPAAHVENRLVEADLFHLPWSGDVSPAAELEEIRWIDPAAPGDLPLAQLTRDHVLPIARRLVAPISSEKPDWARL